jgi:hypothetical protein
MLHLDSSSDNLGEMGRREESHTHIYIYTHTLTHLHTLTEKDGRQTGRQCSASGGKPLSPYDIELKDDLSTKGLSQTLELCTLLIDNKFVIPIWLLTARLQRG